MLNKQTWYAKNITFHKNNEKQSLVTQSGSIKFPEYKETNDRTVIKLKVFPI